MASSKTLPDDLTQYPAWVQKFEAFFHKADLNDNGLLTLNEILATARNMQTMCKATDLQVENMNKGLADFWKDAGLVEGVQMKLGEFLKGCNQMMQLEFRRKQNHETNTAFERLLRASFDVMDINNNGTISLDELKVGMEATNLDPSDAPRRFEMMDKNKNGKIEFTEFCEVEHDFWTSSN